MRQRFCLIRRQHNRLGFTLVEVLLALSIFSLLALCMQSVFYNGIKISRRSGAGADLNHQFVFTFELLERELQNIIPFNFQGISNVKQTFTGTNQLLEFVTRCEDGLCVVRYSLSDEPQGSIHQEVIGETYQKNVAVTENSLNGLKIVDFIRREIPLAEYLENNLQWGKENFDEEILVSSVVEGQFLIEYGFTNDQDVLSWNSSWTKDSIPQAVQLTLPIMADTKKGKVRSLSKTILIPIGSLEIQSSGT